MLRASFFVLFCFFETVTHYVSQAAFGLTILLLTPGCVHTQLAVLLIAFNS
jgi:hypothetical protein